jgi:hypothetical protein
MLLLLGYLGAGRNRGLLMRDRPSSSRHRAVAEAKLGRKLKAGEVIDHKNEDKADNSPENLQALSRSAHTRRHNQARGLSKLRHALRVTRGTEKKSY